MSPVETYIQHFPESTQEILKQIRSIILTRAPLAGESISYGMPAYKTYKKPLVYFAAYSHHIGFYATPTGHEMFKEELKIYKQGKGSVQFSLSEPIPYSLIEKIVVFRVEENKLRYADS